MTAWGGSSTPTVFAFRHRSWKGSSESPADCLRITGLRYRRAANFLNYQNSSPKEEVWENRARTGIHRCKMPFTA